MKFGARLPVRITLEAIDEDIRTHPERLVSITEEMQEAIKKLTNGVEIDLENPLCDDKIINNKL